MQCRIKNVFWLLWLAAALVSKLGTATASGLQLAPDTATERFAESTRAPAAKLYRHESTQFYNWQHRKLLSGLGRSIAQTTTTTTTLPSRDDATSSRPLNFFGRLPAEGSFQVSWSTNLQPSTAISQLQFEVGQVAPPPQVSPAAAPPTSSSANSTSSSSSNLQSRFAPSGTSNGSNDSNSSNAEELASNNSSSTAAPNQPLQATELRPVGGDHLPYVYQYVTGSTEGNPLGLPLSDTPGMELNRWVICAWSVSNSTAPALLGDGAIKHAEQLINNFTAMAPGQIQLAAFANVTVAFAFNGIGTWTSVASGALIQAMSAMAGGYDPSLISVQLVAPEYGIPAAEFVGSGKVPVTTVPANNLVVGMRRVGSSSGDSSSVGSGSTTRRLLSRRLLHDGSASRLQQQQSTSPSRALLAPADGSDGPWGPDVAGTNTSSNGWTKVWVNFSRMAPLNVSSVLGSLSGSCGVDVRNGAADLTDKPCGSTIRQQLMQTGMDVRLAHYAHWLKETPMVSLSIRLAIGITPAQAATGTDILLAGWLSDPLNIHRAISMSGVGDPIGADALIKWLIKPEIWYAMLAPIPGSNALTPAAIVGIALGSAACAALVAAGLVLLLLRHRKQKAKADKDDALSSTSSRRRRHHMRKRRYLAPEPPQPEAAVAPLSTAGSSGHSPTAEQAATVDGDVLTPDHIRPALKELGDSVTSAVRFEDEDAAGEAAAAGAADVTSAAIRTAAVAAATGFASAVPHGTGSGSSQSTSQRVLAARAALIAEQRQGAALPHVSGITNGSHASAAATAGVLPLDDEADATAVPDLVSKRGAAGCRTNKQQATLIPAAATVVPTELQLAELPGLTDGNRTVSAASTTAPVTPSADRAPALQLQSGGAMSNEVCSVHPHKTHGIHMAALAGTMGAAATTHAAMPSNLKGSPSLTSDGSANSLGPATPQPLDLAALGIVPSPLPQPKGNGKTKASPFALSYNFGDLSADSTAGASAIGIASLDNVEPTKSCTKTNCGVGAAEAGTPALQLSSNSLRAEGGSCGRPVFKGGGCEGLLGIGSTETALAYNGNFRQVSSQLKQQKLQQPCPSLVVPSPKLASQTQHQTADVHRCSSPGIVSSNHGSRRGHNGDEQLLSGWESACSSSGSSYNGPHSAQSVHSLSTGYPSTPSSNGPATMGSSLTVGSPVAGKFGPCSSEPAYALQEQPHKHEATQLAMAQQHTWH